MDTIILFISICTLILLLDYWIKPKHQVILPYRVPVIGHLWFVLYYGSDTVKALSTWAAKCGPVCTIQFFHKNLVIVSGFNEIYEVMVTKGNEVGGRMKTFRFIQFVGDKDIGLVDYSPLWRKRKTFVLSLMKVHGEGLGHLQDVALEVCNDFINIIKQKASKGRFDPYEDLQMAMCNTIVSFIAGKKFHADSDMFKCWLLIGYNLRTYLGFFSKGFELDLFPFLRYFGNEVYKKTLIQKATLLKIYHHLEAGKAEGLIPEECLASALLNEVHIKQDSTEDKESVSQIFSDLLSAGIESSTGSLYCFLQIMADHQNIQQKVYDEATSIITKKNESRVTLEHRSEMPYTRALIHELVRYTSVAFFGFPHKSLTPVQIGGLDFDKNTYFVTNLWHLHHTSTLWESPWEFLPERFLDENGDLVAPDHENRKHLLAFGAGTRVCLGQSFAMARLFIFISNIIKEFKIEDTDINHDPRNYQLKIISEPERKEIKFIPRNTV